MSICFVEPKGNCFEIKNNTGQWIMILIIAKDCQLQSSRGVGGGRGSCDDKENEEN